MGRAVIRQTPNQSFVRDGDSIVPQDPSRMVLESVIREEN